MKIFTSKFCRFLFLIIFFSGTTFVGAQSSTSLYWEPEFGVTLSTETPWFYSFGVANRSLHYQAVEGEKVEDFEQVHIELSQFTGYAIGENTAIGLGLRYRFREIFDDSRYDEFRIIEQISYAHPESSLNLAHRFRAEQRFRNVVTEHRLRYQIGIARSLSDNFEAGISTEALYSMANGVQPELEQRLTVEVENSSFRNLELSLGLEYQYENYLNIPESELFILSGVTLKL